jgi:sodium transport system permease protein
MTADMGASGGLNVIPLNFSVDPQAAILLFAVSVFLVMMFSALILSISIYAKSFKEAESYISPAYMVVILPIVLVNSLPSFEPALWHFAIPAINAVLLFKEVLMGTYDTGHILMTFASLIVASVLAILIAAKIYSKESVLFSN